jgi:wobble nucleotide-excising tRNase
MARITNMQNEIAQLQQCLRERNETIARQNRDLSDFREKQKKDAESIATLSKALAEAQALIAAA